MSTRVPATTVWTERSKAPPRAQRVYLQKSGGRWFVTRIPANEDGSIVTDAGDGRLYISSTPNASAVLAYFGSRLNVIEAPTV